MRTPFGTTQNFAGIDDRRAALEFDAQLPAHHLKRFVLIVVLRHPSSPRSLAIYWLFT